MNTETNAVTGERKAARFTKKQVRQILLDLQGDVLDRAEDYQKLFYNTHGQISPDACIAKEQTYRHVADMISKKLARL